MFFNFIDSYYNRIIRYNLRDRLLLDSKEEIPYIKSILISIKLNDLKSIEDLKVLDSLCLLEIISGQKAYLRNIKSSFTKKNKVKKIFGVCEVNLRNYQKDFFFNYFQNWICPIIMRKRLKMSNKVSKNNKFSIYLKDMNLFPYLPERFYFIKLKLNIVFECDLKSNQKNTKYLLNDLLNFRNEIN